MPWACSESPRLRRAAELAFCFGVAAPLWTEPAALASPPWRWAMGSFPVAAFQGYTSPFGLRLHPLAGGVRHHDGLDIAAPLGAPVRNWWAGQVVQVIRDQGCGNGLMIRSGPYDHLYCHLGGQSGGGVHRSGPLVVRLGQWLRTGQLIGHVGLSGSTTGPHLHWGIRYRGAWLDPALVLRAMADSRRRIQPSQWQTPNVGQRP